jgi:hypothetical protein
MHGHLPHTWTYGHLPASGLPVPSASPPPALSNAAHTHLQSRVCLLVGEYAFVCLYVSVCVCMLACGRLFRVRLCVCVFVVVEVGA